MRYEGYECDTSATWVLHERLKCDTSATRTTRVWREQKILILIIRQGKTYFHTPIFTIWQVKDYKERNNFILRTTFWKCIVPLPKCVSKVHRKNWTLYFQKLYQKLKIVWIKITAFFKERVSIIQSYHTYDWNVLFKKCRYFYSDNFKFCAIKKNYKYLYQIVIHYILAANALAHFKRTIKRWVKWILDSQLTFNIKIGYVRQFF